MKAVIRSPTAALEVLQVTTLKRPVPQKNEVLIRVKAAGLDDGQRHLMAGKPYAMRLATGLTKPKQRALGMDVSGVVEAVGTEVSKVEFVRALGATSVIDCTQAPLPTDGRFDVILDLAGNRPLNLLRKALAPRGSLVLGGGEGGDRFFGGRGRTLRAALWSMFLKQRLAMRVGFVKPEPLQALAGILAQPGVTPAVDRSFTLEQAADAMRTGPKSLVPWRRRASDRSTPRGPLDVSVDGSDQQSLGLDRAERGDLAGNSAGPAPDTFIGGQRTPGLQLHSHLRPWHAQAAWGQDSLIPLCVRSYCVSRPSPPRDLPSTRWP